MSTNNRPMQNLSSKSLLDLSQELRDAGLGKPLADQFAAVDKLMDAMFVPQHRFIVVEQDGTETHREPTIGAQYRLTSSFSGDADFTPFAYLGRGMFQIVEGDITLKRGVSTEAFKLDPKDVEYIEEVVQ